MKVVANAALVMGAGNDRTLLADGAFSVEKGSDDTKRAIFVFQGGTLGEPPKGPPVVVIELDAVELRLLVVQAMQTEGVDFAALGFGLSPAGKLPPL